MANWMRDYEEATTERNERVYKLMMERKANEAKQIHLQNVDSVISIDTKCKNYNNGLQKLLWDEQNLLTK